MKLTKSQSGFAPILAVLVLVVLGAAGFAGWKVYDKKNQNSSTIQIVPQEASKDIEGKAQATTQKTATHTVTYQTASYTIELPDGWKLVDQEKGTEEGEHITTITEPSGKSKLLLQIFEPSGSVSAQQADRSFMGIDEKPYYIYDAAKQGATGLFITACEDKHCYTPLRDGLVLNMSVSSTEHAVKLGVNDPIVKQFEEIISSIKTL